MITEITSIALSWLGTPYHHHARVKGVGVDCAQLCAGVATELGVLDPSIQIENYSTEWHLHNKEEKLLEMLERFGCTEVQDLEPGRILCFKFGRVCSHLGIYLGDSQFIHARLDVQKVVINTLSGEWLSRHVKTYSFPTEQIR
jgi:NlpC/P60 family putative phage cell wall peptidase